MESIGSSFSSRALNLRDMMRRATQAAARNMEVRYGRSIGHCQAKRLHDG
jgi:hypothetical protein